MNRSRRWTAGLLALGAGVSLFTAPIAARASEEGRKNTAIAAGAAAAYLLLTQKNKLPGIIAGAGAAYAYKKYDDSVNDRHRRERYGYYDDRSYDGRYDRNYNRYGQESYGDRYYPGSYSGSYNGPTTGSDCERNRRYDSGYNRDDRYSDRYGQDDRYYRDYNGRSARRR